MRILFLNFCEAPENFHFEQAFIRAINGQKGISLDIVHNFRVDLSPLATTQNLKGFRKRFMDINVSCLKDYDLVFSLDFPWRKDKSCLMWLEAIKKGKKKIFVANHLSPMDEHAPFFVWLKEKNVFSIFDLAYFYAFDHPSNFPSLKKKAVRYRTYHIDSVYYSPQHKDFNPSKITVFSAGSKDRSFKSINDCLRENPQVEMKLISNSYFKPVKKYEKRFSLLNLNQNIFNLKSEIARSDIVLVPINDKAENPTSGMAIAFMGMSMGKPVIAKSRMWMRKYIEHGKNGFLYLSASKIPLALKNAIKARKKWQEIGKNARATILKRASLDKFTLKLIREILRK